MSFNITKNKIVSFNSVEDTPNYTWNESVLDHVDSTKYLGVTLQSDCRFNDHISNKIPKARGQLGMNKRALCWAPGQAWLIAYKALYLPHLEYASTAWDPICKKDVSGLEKIQEDAVRFIANIKGCKDVGSAMKKLCLQPLEQRRRNRRINPFIKILAKEEQHLALSSAYDELLNNSTNSTIQTCVVNFSYLLYYVCGFTYAQPLHQV